MPGAIGNASHVDLNRASEQELGQVGGIGPERAARIVQARPFHSWDDVKRVEGFSDKLVNDLREAGATLGGSASGQHGSEHNRSESGGGNRTQAAGSSNEGGSGDLRDREYRDEKGNIHHHTHTKQ